MSHSLIVFEPSGLVIYMQNQKISPFNEVILSIVNESATEVSPGFFTSASPVSQKRFYCLSSKGLYAAIYVDIITTLDSDKIKHVLQDVIQAVVKFREEDVTKMNTAIEFLFTEFFKSKPAAKATERELTPTTSTVETPTTGKKKGAKKMRKWVNGELVDADVNESALDYSGASAENSTRAQEDVKVDSAAFTRQNNLVLINELYDGESDSDSETSAANAKGFFSKISAYFGSAADIQEVCKKFTDQLISKNIAPPTAKLIIDRIRTKINLKTVLITDFKQALTEELIKILTPNVSTDLLYDIKKVSKSRPYVISIVGVNGVGKSTNLAKLAYWLLQNNMNVLICACDTFRSGAVEQLKVHVNNLQRLNNGSGTESKIELFEKGYGGGDHVVNTAKLAIAYAATLKFDIVLIDTAGRTHSNAKLMAPLKKFGDAANPDKIIMVGEALVGTDSVEQAINFNNAFGNKRGLSFFIISKVDTVGDLVGAMINMVMATKVPILFVGTGQTYTDIKKLSVKRVVDMLTS